MPFAKWTKLLLHISSFIYFPPNQLYLYACVVPSCWSLYLSLVRWMCATLLCGCCVVRLLVVFVSLLLTVDRAFEPIGKRLACPMRPQVHLAIAVTPSKSILSCLSKLYISMIVSDPIRPMGMATMNLMMVCSLPTPSETFMT